MKLTPGEMKLLEQLSTDNWINRKNVPGRHTSVTIQSLVNKKLILVANIDVPDDIELANVDIENGYVRVPVQVATAGDNIGYAFRVFLKKVTDYKSDEQILLERIAILEQEVRSLKKKKR